MKRVNVNIPDDLHAWFKEESKRTGMTVNAIMQVALDKYYQEKVVIPFMPKFMEMYEELEKSGKTSASESR